MRYGAPCSICNEHGTKENPTEHIKEDGNNNGFDVIHINGCGSPKQYADEIENMKGILGSFEFVGRETAEITEKLYWQAQLLIIETPKYGMRNNPKMKDHWTRVLKGSREIISELKKIIKAGKKNELPAIALNIKDWSIADGNHRIIALYESGVKKFPALMVKKNEQ